MKDFLHPLRQRQNQIAVHAGQQAGHHFHHGDRGPQRRVDRPQLETDVASADHEQGLGDFNDFKRRG